MTRRVAAAALALSGLLMGTTAQAAGASIVAAPGSAVVGYATPAMAVPAGGELTFVNLDIYAHDVVAFDRFGPDTKPWCHEFEGPCPLFWSALIPIGGSTPVLGLENLVPNEKYTWYCTVHAWMKGTLAALPS